MFFDLKGILIMKCLCRRKGRKEDKYIWSGGDALPKWGWWEKQQEDLTVEVTQGVKKGIFTVVFGEVCISYLIPFQSPEVKQIHDLFKLTEL